MRALITGGFGLVGSQLAKALVERDETVVVLARRGDRASALRLEGTSDRVAVALGDIRERDAVERALSEHSIDTVFHLAGQTLVGAARDDPAATFDVNVRGTWTVLEACRAERVGRVIVASSAKVYGRGHEPPSLDDQPLEPAFAYDASKAAADVIARSYWPSHGLPVAVLRLTNVYGGGDLNRSRLVPEAVWAALAQRAAQIRSDGTPQRDYLHVDDAVSAYLALAAALEEGGARGEAFNGGAGVPRTVLEVVELVRRAAGSAVAPELGERSPAGELDREWVDHSKLTRLTGWRPTVDLETGIVRTVEWYRRFAPQPPVDDEVPSAVGR